MNPNRDRMSVGGKLSFRRRVPRPASALGTDTVLPLTDGGDDPPRLEAIVKGSSSARIEIEVGSGKGAFLIAATEARPDTFWLGIEAAHSYAELAAAKLHEHGRTNAHMLVDNAALFLRDRCEPGSVQNLHVYYPDPWPKRKHRDRRFFAAASDETIHRVLADDGVLFVATDNAGYAGEIARTLGASPLLQRDVALEDGLKDQPGHAFSPTNFERKYLVEGRVLRKWAFRKVAAR